ncbi:helix-turn-helix domain-containing protein [Paenibacillus thermoaerophilus]|uniref:Helix-turn-helix domain-containing protein n=1 Tax=Paenibacillus thermoaerophilus TaxID=1215385 RepID=A0ABW2V0X3_9BACL|nr:helix-turn-helix domain-containing protein [Paenibacillus thermoaerophilus]TMV17737.1 helix-turn-helix domain-containing protein [Paenibacillus thermoaerophilus]
MSKFLFRLLSFSILLGAVPVVFIGVISYFIASGDIEEKVKQGNEQILLQTQMRVEQVMRTLELSAVQYASSPLATKAITQSLTPDDYQQVRDLSQGLYSMQTFGSISEAYLISLDNDWSINFRSFQPFNALSNRDTLTGYAKLPNSLNWITPGVADESADPEQQPKRVIRMVLKIPFVQAERPQGLLVTELPEGEIKQLLAENSDFGEMMVLDEKGNDFLSDKPDDPERSLVAREIFEASQQNKRRAGSFETTLAGGNALVTYRVSDYNNWVYASVVSISEITKQSRNIAWITFVACLVLLLAVAGLGFYGSRRIYSPVRRLFEFTREIEPDPAGAGEGRSSGSRDEFVWIEERLRQLSSKGQQLQQQLRGQYSHLKEYFVLKLFSGQLSESDYAFRSSMYGLPTEWKRLAVLTLQIDTLQGTRYGEHDRELLLFAINNMVGELIPAERRFTPVVHNHSQVTLVVSETEDPAALKQELHELAGSIKTKVYEYLQLKVSVGISRPFERIGDAMKAYHESLEALKGRISLGNDLIIHAEDIEGGQELKAAIYAQLKFLEDQLVQVVKQGDREKADALFGEYIAAIVERDVHFNEYPVLMLQLVAKMYQLVHEQGSTVQKALGEGATVEAFMKLTTLDAIVRWFKQELFDPLFAFLARQSESQYVDIANQMVKIIHERYQEDLSLEMCASLLNFHPVYLSRVFKKETGVNFVDYLVEYRMTIAKQLLETTNDKVSEIAERLRYTNTSAFIRTFRRIVGMTPGQYREQFQQK